MIINDISLKGTSIRLGKESLSKTLIKAIEDEGILLRDEPNDYILENQESYFILENEYTSKATNLIKIIEKYNAKDYVQEIKEIVFEKTGIKVQNVKVKSDDIDTYKEIVSDNIIDGKIREFNVSIKMLNTILDDSKISRNIIDIFILFAIGNRCKYDAGSFNSEFNMDGDRKTISIDFRNSEPINLYPIYEWIVDKNEYECSYVVKLQIFRQVILSGSSIRDIKNNLMQCIRIYRRIISNKTKEYFEQVEGMKNDFIELSRNKSSSLRTLNITLFTWIGALGVKIYSVVESYEGDNIIYFLLLHNSDKTKIIVSMFIIGLVGIFSGYLLEVYNLKKDYRVIKKFYEDKILMDSQLNDEESFKEFIKEPSAGYIQWGVFILILVVLIVRIFI